MSPRVSVVISVHNGERYLRQSIDSVIAQTFGNFELLIVDDGSTDGTPAILAAYDDPRIVLMSNGENKGLAASLNMAFEACRGEFIARLDADDAALPERLERQVAYLDAHPETGIVGSACLLMDGDGREAGLVLSPPTDLEIRWRSLAGNPFQHPAVMVRREVLDRYGLRYDPAYRTAQDYELWIRLLGHTQGANLEQPLVRRRVHGATLSAVEGGAQSDNHISVALAAITGVWSDHPLTRQSFGELREILSTSRPLTPAADRSRCALLEVQAELLERFLERHGDRKGAKELRSSEAVYLTFLALCPPWRPGLFLFLGKLSGIEPNLGLKFIAWALRAAGRRLVGN
jgi:hypothetical protein